MSWAGDLDAGVSTRVFVVDWEEERLSWAPSRREGGDAGDGTFCDAGAVTAGLLLATASMSDIIQFCLCYTIWRLLYFTHGTIYRKIDIFEVGDVLQ